MKRLSLLKPRWIRVGLVLCVLGGIAGIWALLHPAAFWLKPWRPEALAEGRFLFGPYPIEPDFQALQKQQVTTIISLLDSDLFYEKILLGQEQALAERYGMRVLNFPMASILGQSFGKDYLANSRAAAQAALDSKGAVYVHCYLGLHRADNVRKILEASAKSESYAGAIDSGRTPDQLALDRANFAYMDGRMEEVIREVSSMQVKTPEAKLMEAWASYHLERLDAARTLFTEVAAERPDLLDAIGGLAYLALRNNDLKEAERQFKRVLSKQPDDLSSIEGMGHVRFRQGKNAEAKAYFEQVAVRAPENLEVAGILAKLRAAERYVVLIVVDGLRPDALSAAPAPRISELASAGASTSTARVAGIAQTLPSMTTMVTGLLPAAHGIDYDEDRGLALGVPTLFTRVHEAGGRSALYFGKHKLAVLASPGTAELRYGPGLANLGLEVGAGAALAAQFTNEFRKHPMQLALIHLREPDQAGHTKGWMSPEYLAAVRDTDAVVATIRQAIAASGVADRTTVLLTADHGGEGVHHVAASELSWLIPFVCQGAQVKRGAIEGKVTLLDVAPTVLAILGLPPLARNEGHAIKECVPP